MVVFVVVLWLFCGCFVVVFVDVLWLFLWLFCGCFVVVLWMVVSEYSYVFSCL